MEPKVNYALVGLFVVLLGAALLAVVLWLGKGTYGTAYERYEAYMRESVAGLSVDAPVKYHGVEVGRVHAIALNPDNPEEVRLTLDIVRGTPIKEDTVAVLRVQGLTGFAIVDLEGGSREAPLLTAKPGERYPVIKTKPSLLARVNQVGTHLLDNLNRVSEEARAALDEENRIALKHILADLAIVTNTFASRSVVLDQAVVDSADTVRHLAVLSKTLARQLPAVLGRVGKSAAALETMTAELADTGSDVRDLVRENRGHIERFTRQTLAETGFLVAELRELTGSLRRVSRELEQDPTVLVFGRRAAALGPGE